MFQQLLNQPQLKFLKQIKKKFSAAEIFLVGGGARDILLKRPFKDYDFVIKNVAPADLQNFLKKIGQVNLVGKHFGVFKFRVRVKNKKKLKSASNIDIDIALPRSEAGWGTGRHQDFTVQVNHNLDIVQDLQRRDFTVNAMAYDIFKNKIIDPFGGELDLKNKTIRAVLDPKKRFKEDFSRLMRAIRLAIVLNFKIEKKTWQAIKTLNKKLNQIPKELIASELKKMLEQAPVKALNLLAESKILEVFLPEIFAMKGCVQPKNYHSEGDVWAHTKLALSVLEKKNKKRPLDIELALGVLFHDIGKPLARQIEKNRSSDKIPADSRPASVKPASAELTDQNRKISFKEHDIKGAELFAKIAKRLKLENSGINIDEIKFLIRSHMLIFSGDPAKMKNTTLEKYFLKNKKQGKNLLKLIEIDALATIPEKNQLSDLSCLRLIKKRIQQIKNLSPNKQQSPKPLLNGNEIMQILHLKPSPKIGRILNNLREAQLAKKAQTKIMAKKWIKKRFGK